MGIRYNDESYLAAWRDEGKFPRIHDNIFTLFMQTFEADSVIDMCCATGLLGTRISEKTGIDVVGVELLEKNIVRAKKFGVEMEFFQMFIERRTLPAFVNLIKERKATGIVARRCISELFGNTPDQTVDWEWSRIWSAAVAEAGIKEIWIEGRADQGRSVHPVPDTATEIRCLESRYYVDETLKGCAYLRVKDV
jgi:hypothetical protein